MGTKIDIKVTMQELLIFFIKKFIKNFIIFSCFFWIFMFLCSLAHLTLFTSYLVNIENYIIVCAYVAVPFAWSFMQLMKTIKRYRIQDGYIYVKKAKYRLEYYDIEIMHPFVYSELKAVLLGRKQEIVLSREGVKTKIPCDILLRDHFDVLTHTIEENQRRIEHKKNVFYTPDLDNVIFKTRPTAWKFVDEVKKAKMIRTCKILSALLIGTVIIGNYYLQYKIMQEIKLGIIIGIMVLGFFTMRIILQLVYDYQIPPDALISVQLTERMLVFEMMDKTAIFRTHRIQELSVSRVMTNNQELMRKLTFTVDKEEQYLIEFSYGRQGNKEVQEQYYNLVTRLQKFFGANFHFKNE